MAVGAALLAGSPAACAPGRPESSEALGRATWTQTGPYALVFGSTDVGTVHFQGPDWLLTSSEAAAPLELNVRVDQYVQPQMSTSIDVKLDPSAISKTVGYSIAERYLLQGAARRSLSNGEFKRIEAYPAFQRTVWEIRDASTAALLGMGATYRPIGLYFRVVDSENFVLPDPGVPVPEGP
jgi:hypothetical protein